MIFPTVRKIKQAKLFLWLKVLIGKTKQTQKSRTIHQTYKNKTKNKKKNYITEWEDNSNNSISHCKASFFEYKNINRKQNTHKKQISLYHYLSLHTEKPQLYHRMITPTVTKLEHHHFSCSWTVCSAGRSSINHIETLNPQWRQQ